MAWDIIPSLNLFKPLGKISSDSGESNYILGGDSPKVSHPRQGTSVVSVNPCIRSR